MKPQNEPLYKKYQGKSFYNTKAWQRLRVWKLNKDPLCEECLLQDRTTPAVDVHHMLPVEKYPQYALESRFLMSLCKTCHQLMELDQRRMDKEKDVDGS